MSEWSAAASRVRGSGAWAVAAGWCCDLEGTGGAAAGSGSTWKAQAGGRPGYPGTPFSLPPLKCTGGRGRGVGRVKVGRAAHPDFKERTFDGKGTALPERGVLRSCFFCDSASRTRGVLLPLPPCCWDGARPASLPGASPWTVRAGHPLSPPPLLTSASEIAGCSPSPGAGGACPQPAAGPLGFHSIPLALWNAFAPVE